MWGNILTHIGVHHTSKPRTNLNQKVNTTAKSPKHDNFVIQSILLSLGADFVI
jgi:hypothetical protein